jgi:CubicO group peptidase (beta-lactamase class C family)
MAYPPRNDWDRPPWNRWSFQHIREILPTVEVWRGNGPASELLPDTGDLSAISFRDDAGNLTRLDPFLEDSFTDGFLVLHKGRVLTERYMNGMTPRSLHLSQSMAKSITATAFGVLVGRGLLDPDRPVTDYLPELAATGWKGASLQHCLDMQSGVAYSEAYTEPDSDVAKTDVASGWKLPPEGAKDWPRHMWEQVLSLTRTTRPHGELYEYRSIETDVCAFAMERVTGKRLAQIISEEIWQPIGAEESACFTVDSQGYALADGGFNACLRDYARFARLWMEDGRVNGRQIIPPDWVKATHQGDATKFKGSYREVSPNGAYRNQFWLRDVGKRVLMCRGVFGQLIYIAPDQQFAAVKLSSWPEFTNPSRLRSTLNCIEAILAEIT